MSKKLIKKVFTPEAYRETTQYQAEITGKIVKSLKFELIYLIGDFDDAEDFKEKINEAIDYVKSEIKENPVYQRTLDDLMAIQILVLEGIKKVPLLINSDFKDWVKERLEKGE
jgi:hypothetical protein